MSIVSYCVHYVDFFCIPWAYINIFKYCLTVPLKLHACFLPHPVRITMSNRFRSHVFVGLFVGTLALYPHSVLWSSYNSSSINNSTEGRLCHLECQNFLAPARPSWSDVSLFEASSFASTSLGVATENIPLSVHVPLGPEVGRYYATLHDINSTSNKSQHR